MNEVTVSRRYQVTLPRSVCDALSIGPGQKLAVILYDNRIQLIPVRPPKELRGFLKGIDTSIPRDKDRV